jgi:hypothetical protein
MVLPSRPFGEFPSRPGSGRRLVEGEGIRDVLPPRYGELG